MPDLNEKIYGTIEAGTSRLPASAKSTSRDQYGYKEKTNTPDILHKVGIKSSSPEDTYKALATIEGLSRWCPASTSFGR